MRKIFTLAAAVMASMAMMAAEAEPNVAVDEMKDATASTYFKAYEGGVNLVYAGTYEANGGYYYLKADQTNNSAYVGVTSTEVITKVAFLVTGNGSNKVINAGLIGYNEVAETPNFANADYASYVAPSVTIATKNYADAQWVEFDLSEQELKAVYFSKQWKNVVVGTASKASFPSGNAQSLYVYGIRVWAGAPVVISDPVAKVEIEGDEAVYVNKKASYTMTTDVKANAYKWTVDGVEQEGATKASFEYVPEAEGTYTIVGYAKNDNNTDFVASAAITLTVTAKPVFEQVVVTDHTTWDFTKTGATTIQWKSGTTPAKDVDTVLLANVDGFNNDADFNSQALYFAGEYPVRDGQFCQGPYIAFKVNAPGRVTVVFSNTGSKTDARYVMINGVVNTEVGSKDSKAVTSAAIPVEPGEVVIQGAFDNGDVQYLRIYSIAYQRTGWPTAITNTEEDVKAVKLIENGKLIILKNGVKYDAQGARL